MQEEMEVSEDEMVGWHHRLNGQKFEQNLGDGRGQGGLAHCCPWGCKEPDMTEQLQHINMNHNHVSKLDLKQTSSLKQMLRISLPWVNGSKPLQ